MMSAQEGAALLAELERRGAEEHAAFVAANHEELVPWMERVRSMLGRRAMCILEVDAELKRDGCSVRERHLAYAAFLELRDQGSIALEFFPS